MCENEILHPPSSVPKKFSSVVLSFKKFLQQIHLKTACGVLESLIFLVRGSLYSLRCFVHGSSELRRLVGGAPLNVFSVVFSVLFLVCVVGSGSLTLASSCQRFASLSNAL